ncbi:MAG TPA: serine/threonine-protein kinase [Gemmataceae bacterium]|nr:serine/threonine-protein kinase [Gemmataceae bacterium]
MTVDEYCALILQSQLHSPSGVGAIRTRWRMVARDPDNVGDFARWLIATEHLTAHQATLIGRGQVNNFFFSEFKILERIGKGRMAGVYRAVDPGGRFAAIKVLPPSKAQDPKMLARFRREAELASQLDHACIVRTLRWGELRGLHYLIMEYAEGETLEAVLQERGRLTPKETARIGLLTALGLQHVMEKGIVHRDLKPANLVLCPAPLREENTMQCRVKILDIGLGRMLFNPDDKDATAGLTSDGAILGTPDYLAPEQARDASRADIRSDLYSLGCILYHALAGEPPFKDDNLVRQILRHATQQPAPLRERNPDVPAELERVILRLLAKDPGQRYATPAEAAEALKPILSV